MAVRNRSSQRIVRTAQIDRSRSGLSVGGPLEPLVDRLVLEMGDAWRQGQRPLAEEFLARHSELGAHADAALRLIYEEICLRQEWEPGSSLEEVTHRFPQWRVELEGLLDCHRLLDPHLAPPCFPEVGETLGEFKLAAELGRGAQGRVFLAHQHSLADRPVVLKLTPCSGEEHLKLARLQHTHIVPLYSVQDVPARNLRMLCMPYLGGKTLADILAALEAHPREQRHGRHLLEALEQTDGTTATPPAGAPRAALARRSYVEAICHVGAALAEALHYAHQRGLVHLDLKPSNVLLAADGQPMLLDFHLARGPIQPGGSAPEWLGGTPGYMSPEQQAALAAVRIDRPIEAAVDARSDVYSLGVVLFEALAGAPPEAPPRRLDRLDRRVSVGLADILEKCLRVRPEERYATAGELAADLRRHLADQPLRGVANRSGRERWRKWRRRRPYDLAKGLAAAVLLVAAMTAGFAGAFHVGGRRQAARDAIDAGKEALAQHRYREAEDALHRGLEQIRDLPGNDELKQALVRHLRLVRRARKAGELRGLAESLRFFALHTPQPRRARVVLEAMSRNLWKDEDLLATREGANLELALEQGIRDDLADVAAFWTDLQVSLAPPAEVERVRRAALERFAELETRIGPHLALSQARHTQAQALGQAERAEEAFTPRSAWEYCVLGRGCLQRGELEAADRALQRAYELDPFGFWPNFHRGVCAFRRGRPAEALQAFCTSVGQMQGNAECRFHRARAYAALGDARQALSDCNLALQLHPKLGAAWLLRGILHGEQKQHAAALADLRQALAHEADPAEVHYRTACVQAALGRADEARASLKHALQHRPDYPDARRLQASLGP